MSSVWSRIGPQASPKTFPVQSLWWLRHYQCGICTIHIWQFGELSTIYFSWILFWTQDEFCDRKPQRKSFTDILRKWSRQDSLCWQFLFHTKHWAWKCLSCFHWRSVCWGRVPNRPCMLRSMIFADCMRIALGSGPGWKPAAQKQASF